MFSKRTHWPLAPNELTLLARSRRERGLPVLDLTESNPTRCGFEYGSLLEAFLNPHALRYEPNPRGLLSARQAVAEYYAERGACVDPAQIFLTASTSEAYSFVFRLLANVGDAALAPRPSYPLFEFLARLNDIEMAAYPLVYDAGWCIDQAALLEAISPRTRAVLAVHPNNPTGSYISPGEASFLVDCCARNNMALIIDEVFFDYAYRRAASGGAPNFVGEKRALTFTLNGISKISALPQMKCAWIIVSGPEKLLISAMDRLELIADTYLSVSTPVACALPRLLELRNTIQPRVMRRVMRNLSRLDALIKPDSLVERLGAEGGWCAILRLPSILTDEQWALRLLSEDGVLLHPGHFYDFVSEARLVISLLPRPDIFDDAISRLTARVARDA